MGVGTLIDTERKGCESIIHDHDCDLWVTMVGWVNVPYSDWGDFRRQCAVDISISQLSSCWLRTLSVMTNWLFYAYCCKAKFMWVRKSSTHLSLDKMAMILQTAFFRCIFMNEFCILIKISLKFVLNGPIGNNPALVQIMTWCQTGDKPLSESMLTQFTDA